MEPFYSTDFLIKALEAGGYTFQPNEISGARFAGVTETGSMIFRFTYREDGEPHEGSAYIKFTDGRWKADF